MLTQHNGTEGKELASIEESRCSSSVNCGSGEVSKGKDAKWGVGLQEMYDASETCMKWNLPWGNSKLCLSANQLGQLISKEQENDM